MMSPDTYTLEENNWDKAVISNKEPSDALKVDVKLAGSISCT